MVWADDVHVRDQPAARANLAASAAAARPDGRRRTGSAPRRARVSPHPAGSFAEHRRRSKMQHAIALEVEPPPDLRWSIYERTHVPTGNGAIAAGAIAREKCRRGRSVFLECPLPGRKMTERAPRHPQGEAGGAGAGPTGEEHREPVPRQPPPPGAADTSPP